MCCSSSLWTVTVHCVSHPCSSDSIRHRLAEYLYKVQIYVHEKISIYMSTSTWFDQGVSPRNPGLHSVETKRQFNQVSTLGSIGDISPRFSYCNHYVLCKVLLSFSCFSNLRDFKFWKTCSFCFLLRWHALSGFSHCPFISIHLAELWYWWPLTCCWPQYLAWFPFLFFNILLRCPVLVFNFFSCFWAV